MFNPRNNTEASGERGDGRSSSTTGSTLASSARPSTAAPRPSALPPIVVVATSGAADLGLGTPGGVFPVTSGRHVGETADPTALHMAVSPGALVPFCESPARSPSVSHTTPVDTRAPPIDEEAQGRGDSVGDDRSLVPHSLMATAPPRLGGYESPVSPSFGPLAVARHGHVCPTCGRPLDNLALDAVSEGGEEGDAPLYGGAGGGRSWSTRPRAGVATGGGRRAPLRVVSTYPSIGPGPATSNAGTPMLVSRPQPAALLCDSSGRDAQTYPSGSKVGNALSPSQHGGESGRSAGAAAGNRGVVERSANGTNVMSNALTPHYFRALPRPARPSVLAISNATSLTPASTERTTPITIVSDDTISDDQDDIAAYVSPTGRHPPRGLGYPVIEPSKDVADSHNNLVVPVPCPPQTAQPAQSRPSPPPATAATAATVPTPPLASAPAPTESYYGRYFVEIAKLGSGAFGGVYLCQHVMEGVSLGLFALKKIPVGDAAPYLQSVLREVRILEEVKRHPNVVEYSHSWVEEAQLADFGPPVRCLFILMEYASEGSLDAYMDRSGAPLSTVAVWYFFLSAVAGTAHLHSKAILHRDLKPQNLLLTSSGDGRPPRVLVSDFGTAALLDDTAYDRTGGTGTLEYMAPELMERDAHVVTETYVNRHTKASDIWALGMILYYLAFDGTLPPMREDGTPDLRDLLNRGSVQRPPEMLELLRAMLQRDPARRPSCQDILHSTVVQTIIRAFNHPNRSEADIFEPMTAFRSAGGRERWYTPAAIDPEEASVDEEVHGGEEYRSGSGSLGTTPGSGGSGRVSQLVTGFTRLLMDDDKLHDVGAPIPIDQPSSTASSPRSSGRDGGSSRVELLSMTSTLPLGYQEKREQYQQQPSRQSKLSRQKVAADSRAGSAGADMPPLFARYHSNDVRRNSMVPVTGEGAPVRGQAGGGASTSTPSPPPQLTTAERTDGGKRARQSSFSRNFANSPPPERRRRVATADAAVQTDPVTILDAP